MKLIFLAFLNLLAVSAMASPTVVHVPYQRAYIPEGFDSNDAIEFVLEGAFPSTCYRPGFVGALVQRIGNRIEVDSTAFFYDGLCLDVMVPFSQTVLLAPIPAGRYTVAQARSPNVLGELIVKPALSAEPDDQLYAPISQAMFQQRGGGGEVLLTGTFPTNCFSIADVQVKVGRSAIVLLPIATSSQGTSCVPAAVPFQRRVVIPSIPRGRYVLHVRSMNGHSVNSLIDVR